MLFGFILTIILGRYLGAEDLGLYRMSSTIYGFVILIAALGIPSAIIKYVAESKQDQEKINSLVSSCILTSFIIGIVISIIFYLCAGCISKLFNMPNLYTLLIILSIIFPFALVSNVLLGFLNGLRYMKQYAIATVFQGLFTFVVSFLLIYLGYGVQGVIISMILSSMGYFVYILYISKNYFQFTLSNYITNIRETLNFGIKVLLSNGINQINYQADTILIGYFTNAVYVGYYSIAVMLSTFFWLIPQSIQAITYPAISEYWSKNNLEAIQMIVDKSIKYSACLLIPIGMLVTFLSQPIIDTIYGNNFDVAILPLQILILGTIINGSLQRPIGSILYAIGLPDLNLKIFTFAAIGNIFLNILLIPLIGIVGASIATTFSYIFITFLILHYTLKYTHIKIDFAWILKIGAFSVIIFLINSYLSKIFSFIGIILIAIFSITIWLYFLSDDDKSYILNYIKSITHIVVSKINIITGD